MISRIIVININNILCKTILQSPVTIKKRDKNILILEKVDTITGGNKIYRVPLQDKLTQVFLLLLSLYIHSFSSALFLFLFYFKTISIFSLTYLFMQGEKYSLTHEVTCRDNFLSLSSTSTDNFLILIKEISLCP